MKILGFVALGFLSLSFGTAYAVVAKGLNYYDGPTLNSIRMCFAFWGSVVFILSLLIIKPSFYSKIGKSIEKGETPLLSSMFCGMLNYGLPHSLITIAQRSIPSTIVVIVQPFVSLFELFFAAALLNDEKFSFKKLLPQLIAIIGSTLSSFPNLKLGFEGTGESSLLDYLLLLIALLSFAFGMVYIKAFLKKANNILIGVYQLFGAAIYSTIFAIARNGFGSYIDSIIGAGPRALIYPFVLGVCFTCSATFLMVYTIKELGAVVTGYSNYLQILIGVVFGVLFMHEWDNYTKSDYIFSFAGLIVLVISVFIGLSHDDGKNNNQNLLD